MGEKMSKEKENYPYKTVGTVSWSYVKELGKLDPTIHSLLELQRSGYFKGKLESPIDSTSLEIGLVAYLTKKLAGNSITITEIIPQNKGEYRIKATDTNGNEYKILIKEGSISFSHKRLPPISVSWDYIKEKWGKSDPMIQALLNFKERKDLDMVAMGLLAYLASTYGYQMAFNPERRELEFQEVSPLVSILLSTKKDLSIAGTAVGKEMRDLVKGAYWIKAVDKKTGNAYIYVVRDENIWMFESKNVPKAIEAVKKAVTDIFYQVALKKKNNEIKNLSWIE